MNRYKLLYLGFAFPPGVQAMHPAINPAGHAFETQMISHLRSEFEIRSVGTLPFGLPNSAMNSDNRSGVLHDLLLIERPPEIWNRWHSLRKLKNQYCRWIEAGWEPEAVLTYNLSPIYNNFVRWLNLQTKRPRQVLLLLDSSNLGRSWPWSKRFRYRFKPFAIPDAEMIDAFDACVGLSKSAEEFFAKRPFLWMPGGCDARRGPAEQTKAIDSTEPIRFGYFGSLAPHSGLSQLIEVFLSSAVRGTLQISGYGKQADQIAAIAAREPRIKFHGLLPSPEDCLRFGRDCDVLINPRPKTHGNENNFPSKLFDYALCGRAILTSKMSGVEEVLGPDAFYFLADPFLDNLCKGLNELAKIPRTELRRRGHAIQDRVTKEYSWDRQAARMAEFIRETCARCTTNEIRLK